MSGEDTTAIQSALDAYAEAELLKVDSIARFIRLCEYQAAQAKQEAERISTVSKRWENRAWYVKNAALAALMRAGKTVVESATNRLRRQKNPPSIDIVDSLEVPGNYILLQVRVTSTEWHRLTQLDAKGTISNGRNFDRESIRRELEAGRHVPGCKLVTDREHLRVE